MAETLGIAVERVRNAPHDTALVPDSGPTVASRTTMVVGGVAAKAAGQLRAALAAEVGFEGDFDAMLAARKSVASLRVQAEYTDDGTLVWDPKTYQGDAYPAFGWCCVIVDLEVDLDTGEVTHRRLVQATDVGRAINPVLCSGQLEGGALQALGYATCEELVLDAQHGMRNNRLTNYIIPTSLDAPEMETIMVEIPFAGGPFGAKGIGEIPHDVPHAAVAQAIEAGHRRRARTTPHDPRADRRGLVRRPHGDAGMKTNITFTLNDREVTVDAAHGTPARRSARGSARDRHQRGLRRGRVRRLHRARGRPGREQLPRCRPSSLQGAAVQTVEGLAQSDRLHPIQEAFLKHGGAQCGICTPGFLVAAAELLEREPHPTRAQVREALAGNLCRCTGYQKIVDAVVEALA